MPEANAEQTSRHDETERIVAARQFAKPYIAAARTHFDALARAADRADRIAELRMVMGAIAILEEIALGTDPERATAEIVAFAHSFDTDPPAAGS